MAARRRAPSAAPHATSHQAETPPAPPLPGADTLASAGYVLEDQIGYLLRRAHQRATSVFLAVLGEAHQITPTQLAALVKLCEHGELSQNLLGRLTAMDPATIQGVIRRLEARALIERSGDPGDRRRAKLKLTASGSELTRRLLRLGLEVSDATLEPLSAEERRVFLGLLARLA